MKILELEIFNFEGIEHLKMVNMPKDVVLIGENGSGKSTILRALSCILSHCHLTSNKLFERQGSEFKSAFVIKMDLSSHYKELKATFKQYISVPMISVAPNIFSGLYVQSDEDIILKQYIDQHIDRILVPNLIVIISNEFYWANVNYIKHPDERVVKLLENKLRGRPYTQSNNIQEKFRVFFGYLIHRWLQTRSTGHLSTPGFSVLDMEIYNPRDIKIDFGQMPKVTKERARELSNQTLRTKNLGTRLAALVYDHKADVAEQKVHKDSPIDRINKSIQKLIPHLKIKAPRSTNTEIIASVRGKDIPLGKLSTGEVNILTLAIDYLEMEVNNGVIIVDEPSVHLHYTLQADFIAFLKELAYTKNNKPSIWISTHSPAIIQSMSAESRFVVDISNEDNAIRRYTDFKTNHERSVLSKSLGISDIFNYKPALFLEGKTDLPIIREIFQKFYPDAVKQWQIKRCDGVDEMEQIESYTQNLQKLAGKHKFPDLFSQLSQNHFLMDYDNHRTRDPDSNTFVWDFYHIENLMFQDPWYSILPQILRLTAKRPAKVDFENDIEKAKKSVYNSINPAPSFSYDDIKTEKWRKVLPGREVFTELKKIWEGGKGASPVIAALVGETNTLDQLPTEIQRFLEWVKKKYEEWKTG